jgi:hypothetical protein
MDDSNSTSLYIVNLTKNRSTHTLYLGLYKMLSHPSQSVKCEKMATIRHEINWCNHYGQSMRSSEFFVLALWRPLYWVEMWKCTHFHGSWWLYFIQSTVYRPFYCSTSETWRMKLGSLLKSLIIRDNGHLQSIKDLLQFLLPTTLEWGGEALFVYCIKHLRFFFFFYAMK